MNITCRLSTEMWKFYEHSQDYGTLFGDIGPESVQMSASF